MSTPVSADELGRLLDERGGSLALYASQWTADAEDCVQEALLELARLPCKPESPVAWLYRVVKHRAMNRARGERRRRVREKAAWQQRLADRPTPTDLDERIGERIDLVEALACLPDEDRELVLLRVEAGLSFAEIAEVTGNSSSTAHRQYTAALQTLRNRLDDSIPPGPFPRRPRKMMSDRKNKLSDEPSLEDPALQKLEACLAERLVACPTAIDRDQLLYRAGWEAAKEKHPVAMWRWPLATRVMTAATVGLVFLQIDTQRRLEGLEQQVTMVAAIEVEIAPEPEFIPPLKPLSTRQKRPAWPLLAAWGLAPEPIRRERGTALSSHWMPRDGIDPLEEWDRTRLVHTTPLSDSSDRPFPPRQPATARELMKEWFPERSQQPVDPPQPVDPE